MKPDQKANPIPYTLINEFTEEVIQFIRDNLDIDYVSDKSTVLAFRDDEGILGGWVFERYTGIGGSVTVHWCGRDAGWLKLGMLEMCAHYVFEQLACELVIGEVPESDHIVRQIDEKLGFKQLAVIPGYFLNDNLVIYGLTRCNCRFLPANMEAQNG